MIDGGQLGKLVIVLPVVPTIDAGKRAESGQGGYRAAVPVVPTIDAGKLTAGKPVIVRLRSPWCRRSTPASSKGKRTAGKAVIDLPSAGLKTGQKCAIAEVAGKAVIDLASAGALPRPCPCRRAARSPWCR